MDDTIDWTNTNDEEEQSVGFPQFEEGAGAGIDLKPIDIKAQVRSDLTNVAVAEDCFLMATKANQIIRKKLNPESDYESLNLPSKSDTQTLKLFLDVHGFHTIITCSKDESYYLNIASAKVLPLNMLKGYAVTSVAFSLRTTQGHTGDILVGMGNGEIHLYGIDLAQDSEIVESPLKKVFQLPQPSAIYGLAYETYDCFMKHEQKVVENVLVIAATNEACFQFSGALPFAKLFEKYAAPAELNKHKKTAPKGNLDTTELKLCHTYKGRGVFEMHSFAWKTGIGVFHGKFRSRDDVKSRIIVKDMPLEAYKRKGATGSDIAIPESIGISSHNLYLLYPDSITILSKITHEVVRMESFHHGDGMRCMCCEASSKSLWIHSAKNLLRLLVPSNAKDLWRQHVESGNFQEALKHCKEFDKRNYGKVAAIYANSMFKSGKYSEAAILYAESSSNFEDVVLKFLRAGVTDELELYLMKKLEGIKHAQGKKTQRVVLCTWLVELRLDKLNKLEAASESELPENAGVFKKVQKQEAIELYKKAVEEFKSFLVEYEEDLEAETIFQLLQSHGRLLDCLSFASQKKNYEAVVLHHINNREFRNAVEVVNDIADDNVKNSLMTRYASVFMKHEIKFAIDSLCRYYPKIKAEDLITSLISIDIKDRLLANNYIKLVMDRTNSQLLYNLYVFFLAESKKPESLSELQDFLDQQEQLHRNNQPINVDKDFALNVCKHFGLIEAQVKVYGLLEFYEEAVKLALAHKQVDLAKKYANMPLDEKIRKKLWTEVARAVMQEGQQDLKAGFKVINESKILTLGDVLQFLSPKMKLAVFKDDLVASLQAYGGKIGELRKQMNDYSKSAEEISAQLKELQSSCIPVPTEQYCDKCKKPLLGNERFYIFPCLHSFHRSCLMEWMFEYRIYVPKFKMARLERIDAFMKKMAAVAKKKEEEDDEHVEQESKGFLNTIGNLFMRNKNRHAEETKQTILSPEDQETMKTYEYQLEVLLTEDCMLCGNLFIESIDIPFDCSDEFSWAIS